jgi:hypothetical protein
VTTDSESAAIAMRAAVEMEQVFSAQGTVRSAAPASSFANSLSSPPASINCQTSYANEG